MENMPNDNQEPEQPALPDMELVQMIEGLAPEARLELKRHVLEKISDGEQVCRLIDDINHSEGLDAEIIY